MKKPIYIYGAGGLGREVLSWLPLLPDWEPVGFIDDTTSTGTVIKGLSVVGGIEVVEQIEDLNLVLAIGSPGAKKAIALQLLNRKINFPTLIHPSVVCGDCLSVQVGSGSVIAAGSILTTDIQIGDHVLINLNCTVGHDTYIGHYSSLMCGINVAGEVHIGDSVLIGSGANIRNRIHIGDGSTVGMGAAVIQNVQSGTVVVGVPAKPMKA